MNRLIAFALSALFPIGMALAQGHPANFARPVDFPARTAESAKAAEAPKRAASNCEDKAVGKDGKPLSGEARNAFIRKCEGDTKASK